MVATTLTWDSGINRSVSGASAVDQYKEFLVVLHKWLRRNWTVVFSSDGSTADGNDNIEDATDIVFGVEGVDAHSYAVYQSPVGFGVNGGTMFFHWNANESGATPQDIDVATLVSPNSYSLDASPLINRPVASGDEIFRAGFTVRPSAANVPQSAHRWDNNRGEIIFGTSIDGTGRCESLLWLYSPDNGEGINDFGWFFNHTAVGAGAVSENSLTTSANHRAHWIDGTQQTNNPQFVSAISEASNWTNGLSMATNNPLKAPIDFMSSASTEGRYMGRVVDIRGTPTQVAYGTLEDGDVDIVRLVSFGSLLIPTTNAQLPLVM